MFPPLVSVVSFEGETQRKGSYKFFQEINRPFHLSKFYIRFLCSHYTVNFNQNYQSYCIGQRYDWREKVIAGAWRSGRYEGWK